MVMILVLQSSLFVAVLLWLSLQRPSDKVWAGFAIGAAGLALVGVGLAGLWVYPPRWALAPGGLVYAMVSYCVWRRSDYANARGALRRAVLIGGSLTWTILGGALVWQSVAGHIRPRGETYDLAAPLLGEGYCVISGGASALLNFHMETLAAGKEAYRGQSYGVDFIARSPLGFRTIDDWWWRAAPDDPRSYRIFGAPVVAPCAGEVMTARDGLPDQPAGVIVLRPMAGNHVILSCGDHEVLLAHLRQDSVSVAQGQAVEIGDRLGEVGNTGASDEPHLHVSVQRAAVGAAPLGGPPVHLSFSGRFLARGDCL